MKTMRFFVFSITLLQLIISTSSIKLHVHVAKCLSDLATQEYTTSYNYLQLSLKLGTDKAYPGFSSFLMKLSDDDASKAHDLVKLLVLRKAKLDRLININGVSIRADIKTTENIVASVLSTARNQSREAWNVVRRCHQEAETVKDAHVQDYLESHFLEHHIKIDKLFADFQNRLADAQIIDQELTIFMLDEELLNTYGDYRQDIFS